MSDLLSIGSSGVAAYQRALTTVSNNISNVGTEGYVRQETALSENMPRNQGRVYLGTGVSVAGINRAYDQFLEQNLRNSTSELNTQGPMVNYANRVVDIMGSDTVGLNNSLDKFLQPRVLCPLIRLPSCCVSSFCVMLMVWLQVSASCRIK